MIASAEQMRRALCARSEYRGLPWISEATSPAQRAAMASVCAACPVLATCAAEVATTLTTAGFWAGQDHTARDYPVQGVLDLDLGLKGHRVVPAGEVADLGDGWVLVDPQEYTELDGSTRVGGLLAKVRNAA
ncbi:WhiB family transcriptional regulator [Promicromonospora sp. NPDC050262]|uniref:WhiB family transcriptional regulator n=1 Tax=Promicromonospora sp. NPDC050262 TaxID=3155036 RepID=UPI0033DE0986